MPLDDRTVQVVRYTSARKTEPGVEYLLIPVGGEFVVGPGGAGCAGPAPRRRSERTPQSGSTPRLT
jgi:hypothetical protein